MSDVKQIEDAVSKDHAFPRFSQTRSLEKQLVN
jgi:hypothetical protein